MTDQERFEEWYREYTKKLPKDRYGCYLTPGENVAFLAAIEMGRRERTVEIDKTYGSYHIGDAKRNPMHKLSIELRFDYPDCFGEGEE